MADIDSTTKTCSKCKTEYPATTENFPVHTRKKDGLGSWCKACHRQYQREYYVANAEKRREQMREYDAANKEKKREYREANKEKINERDREYYAANKEKKREYREVNREKLRERAREYHQTPRGREVARTRNHRRRARKASAPLGLPFNEQAQLKRQKSRCYYCGRKLTEYHIDHVIPLSRGGCDGAENKVLACPDCNLSKHDKLPHEWAEGGRLL